MRGRRYHLPKLPIPDGWPRMVVDADGTSTDIEFPDFFLDGTIQSSQLLYWPSDTSLQAFIVSNMNGPGGGQFVFDHGY